MENIFFIMEKIHFENVQKKYFWEKKCQKLFFLKIENFDFFLENFDFFQNLKKKKISKNVDFRNFRNFEIFEIFAIFRFFENFEIEFLHDELFFSSVFFVRLGLCF